MGNSCGISEEQESFDYQTSHISVHHNHHNRNNKKNYNSKYTDSDFKDFEEYNSKLSF